MGEVVSNAVLVIIVMALSLTVHEFAHAWAAKWLGDDTAERQGRLNLNPLNHADPIGTVLLPLFILLANGAGGGVPFFGWARPVPTNPMNYRRSMSMRKGMMLVALAGPVSNLLLGFITVFVLISGIHGGWYHSIPPFAQEMLRMLFGVNVALFVFNMIPIYPLDGQKVLSFFLKGQTAQDFERFNMQYGSMMLMLLVFFGHRFISKPIMLVNEGMLAAASGIIKVFGI